MTRPLSELDHALAVATVAYEQVSHAPGIPLGHIGIFGFDRDAATGSELPTLFVSHQVYYVVTMFGVNYPVRSS